MTGEFHEVPFEVEANYAGWRLDRYLCEKIPRLSRTQVQELIRTRLRCSRALKPASLVVPGLRFALLRPTLSEPPTPDAPATVLHRDEPLLLVDKPAGLHMPPPARYFQGTLVARLRAMEAPGVKFDPAHRLDRETSGVVVCGTSPAVTSRLKTAFARGQVHKTYQAVVEGTPEFVTRRIDLPLAVGGEVVRIKMRIDAAIGKQAITEVSVLQRFVDGEGQPFALVECHPLTGRQHQIRAHLSHIGLPLVGDKIYGPDEKYFVAFTEHALDDAARAHLRLDRHALHAAAIDLTHPVTGRALRVEAPLPEDLRAFLATLHPRA